MRTKTVKIQDSALNHFNQRYGGGYLSELGAIELAQEHDWSGFAFVMDNSGPVRWQDASDNNYGHFCTFAVEKVNYEVITEELGKVKRKGIESYEGCVEYVGYIAYDYGNIGVRTKVVSLERALAGYPVLDDMRMSELEHENALKVLENCHNIPEDLASDVMEALHDAGHGDCPDCESWDVEGVLDTMGWRECAECSEVIETETKGAVCRDCADSYSSVVCEGECLSVTVDAAYTLGFMTTAELEAVTCECPCECGGLCERCYQENYPYGRD
ncbi:hypothetical protein [Streptomyces sp. NBC_00197]|uniref:hypothetical protein n=1 Tax=Streptomyces sp. NBC_00197 TaxID=2975676 RepID=UPI003250A477